VGTFILIAGRLGDMYGHKRIFIIGFIWFGVWSLVTGFSAFAKSDVFFDICRALQGIGPAFMLPNALAILGRVYPNGPRKGMVFSLFGATAPNGFLVGAVFSAIFAQFAWWPWAFWANGIACFTLALIARYAIPDVDEEIRNNKHNRVEFDVYGAVTGVVGLVLINFAWNQGPVVGWDVPYTFVLLIIGVLIIGVFVFAEKKAKQPLVPPGSFNLEVVFVLGCIALGWASFGIWVFYFWQFLEVLRGLTPILCVAMFAPVGISGATAAVTTGFLLRKLPTSVIMTISMCAFCAGSILLATTPVNQTYWAQTFVAIIITPWGMDMSFPSATIILSNNMPREHQGIAASLINTVVNYSISIGLGVAGTVQRYAVEEGEVLQGYRSAWYTGIGFAGMGIALGLFSVVKTRKKADGH
jgi:MFS family permease